MKERLWRRAASTYLAPQLPGEWHAAGSVLYREPLDWILICLSLANSSFSSNFHVSANAQVLAVPIAGLPGPHIIGLIPPGRGSWEAPTSVSDAEPIMQEVAELAREKALPFLDRMGTIAGFRVAAEAEAQERPDSILAQETIFCLCLIDGDLPGALHAAAAVKRATDADGMPHAREAARRVARAAQLAREDLPAALHQLRNQAEYTRTMLKLPPDPTLHATTLP